MATKSTDQDAEQLQEVNRLLKLALNECQELTARTERMLRKAGQDNDPRSLDSPPPEG